MDENYTQSNPPKEFATIHIADVSFILCKMGWAAMSAKGEAVMHFEASNWRQIIMKTTVYYAYTHRNTHTK